MSVQHQINTILSQKRPDRIHILRIIHRSHKIDRVMIKRNRTDIGMSCKISSQPLILRRIYLTASHLHAVAVEGNDVPSGRVKTIVVGNVIPIIKIADSRCVSRIFVIPNDRISNRTDTAEVGAGRAIPVVEFRLCTLLVYISEIKKQVWIPGGYEIRHAVRIQESTCPVTRRSQGE